MSVALVAAVSIAATTGRVEAQTSSRGSGLMPVAVFGTDDRVPLPARWVAEQNAIGLLIDMRTRSVCTAFCVSDSIIATAGHCLFKTVGESRPRLTDFWFARNYDQVRDLARIAGFDKGAAAQNVIAGSMALKVSPPIDASSDWALVRLARPVCSSTLKLQPISGEAAIAAGRGGKVFQIAYHRDFTLWRQAYSQPCKLERSFAGVDAQTIAADFKSPAMVLLHTCDTGGASSGSPVFTDTPEGPRVIGINIGTYVQSKQPAANGASAPPKAEAVANTAVSVAGLADRISALKTATIVATAAGIRELQEDLRRLGHYNGALDGSYGSGLQRAIEAYEAAHGLPLTGVASQALKERLKRDGR